MSLGISVSISNDGQTIIAGAPDLQTNSTSPGKVLIFSYQLISGTASWTYKASIAGSNNQDYFGYSSSINGNGDKIIVGAYDGNFTTPGYARIYSWDGTTASQIGSDIVGGGGAFGAHVELSANGIAVIGAPLSDSGGSNSGQVKVIGTDRYESYWDVDGGFITPPDGSYYATVAGTDLAGNNYAGTDSVTIILDSTLPSVILGDSDDDNILGKTDVVTITALFSEAMTGSPTISISGTSVNNAPMSSNSELDSRAFIILDANFPNSTIGNVIKDKGTNGNDFTLTNGTQFVQSSGENYYSFDGVNDNIKPVNYPNITNGISGTHFTFLFRIKFNSLPVSDSSDRFFTFNRSASTFANQFQLRLKSDGRIRIFMDGGGQGGNDSPTSSSGISTDEWYNIAFVKSGTS